MTRSRATAPPPAPPPHETDLIDRLRAGDEAAFDQLVREVGPMLLGAARRILPCESDAHDAVQDAFLSAFKALDRFEGRSQLATWLRRIVVNACYMKLRTRGRRPERSIDALLPEFLPDGHQANPSSPWKPIPAGGIEQREVVALVRIKINELPESYRQVLMLRDFEELDTHQTAQLLGISPGAVKVRLHRARQALRTLLDPHFNEALA